MRGPSLAIAVLLILSGCSGEAEQSAPTQSAETTAPAEGKADQASDQNTNMIPANFQGVWDYVGGTCAPESDLRMEISGGEILFYESVGRVTASVPDDGDVLVTLEMEGEGETWVQAYRLSLSEGDQILNTQAIGEGIVGGPLPRKRCER